jgi:peptidoglycan/LPS O-acetylase OafA/YrhL
MKILTGAPLSDKPSGYLPTLDGWRAIAIVAVIFHHDVVHTLGRLNTRWLTTYGYSGVDVFFAISGILICSRLLKEEEGSGHISLAGFYARRAFRILPPAFLYLLVVALLSYLSVIHVSYGEWFGALLFCKNYSTIFTHDNGWYVGHFWSLALEEQFYFILPAILVFGKQKYRLWILSTLALAVVANRAVALHFREWQVIQFHAGVRIDFLLVPAIMAVIISKPAFRESIRSRLTYWPLLIIPIFLLIPYEDGSAWRITLIPWLMSFLILGSILNPTNLFGRFLELAPLRYLGRISYSIYLWQQLFYNEHYTKAMPLGILQSWPLRILVTLACAIASYYLIEQPCIRLGRSFIRRKGLA